ncbi:MAG TPA: cyclic nucleotide-binding domain-containing protein [Rhizomicrobium sp.]|nr:cyclic nucleotide-binding domain-containing protein [Rhizomicrobium sp.]
MPISLSAVRNDDRFAAFHPAATMSDDAPLTLNDHLRLIHGVSSRLHFRRGETIFAEGDAAGHVYKVLTGTVRLCRFLPDGRRHVGEFVLAGDLMGFLECPNHPATAEAVDDVTLVAYPRSAVERLAASDPTIRRRITSHLSSSLLEAQKHLFVLGCQRARERVASFLARLADRSDVGQGETLDIAMSRQDIADHLGMTVETVCRMLALLKAEGTIVVLGAGQIILKNLSALRVQSFDH